MLLETPDKLVHDLDLDRKLAAVCCCLHRLDCVFNGQGVCDELSDISEDTLVCQADDFRP